MAAGNLTNDPGFSYLEQDVDIQYATSMSMRMRLTIGPMIDSSSISLRDSLFLGVGDATAPVPEPTTLLELCRAGVIPDASLDVSVSIPRQSRGPCVHMVWHQVSLNNPAFSLRGKVSEYFPQARTQLRV